METNFATDNYQNLITRTLDQFFRSQLLQKS